MLQYFRSVKDIILLGFIAVIHDPEDWYNSLSPVFRNFKIHLPVLIYTKLRPLDTFIYFFLDVNTNSFPDWAVHNSYSAANIYK